MHIAGKHIRSHSIADCGNMQHSSGLSDDDKLCRIFQTIQALSGHAGSFRPFRLFQAIQDVGRKMNSCMDELAKTVDGFKGEVAKQLHWHDEDIVGI